MGPASKMAIATLTSRHSSPHVLPSRTEPGLVLCAQYNMMEVTACDFPLKPDYKRTVASPLVSRITCS